MLCAQLVKRSSILAHIMEWLKFKSGLTFNPTVGGNTPCFSFCLQSGGWTSDCTWLTGRRFAKKDGNVKIDFCTSRSHAEINKLPITVCMNDLPRLQMFGFCEMEDEKCESKPQFSSKLSQVYKSSAAYQPGTLTLMQSETFWVSYLFQIPLDLCVYTRNTPKLKKAVGGGTITSPDDIFPQKPIFESNCGVNAPWLAHTARTKQKWNSRFAYFFFFSVSCWANVASWKTQK